MKIKLIFYVLIVVNFALAKNDQKRSRPVIDSTAQDNDGNFFDQIASDSISYSSASSNAASSPDRYASRYYTATDEFRKSFVNPVQSQTKVHYVTPEPYNYTFRQDYLNFPKPKEIIPNSSSFEHSSPELKKKNLSNRKKIQSFDYEDYTYKFPESKKVGESKRIIQRTTSKPPTTKESHEKYLKPQIPGAKITKEIGTDGDETVNTYHYYYPEEASVQLQKSQIVDSSTLSHMTTKILNTKFSSKNKLPSSKPSDVSTDSHQYNPVLPRPIEYTPDLTPDDNSHKNYLPFYSSSVLATPSTSSPIKNLRPNNYYLPTSTTSPLTTAKPKRIRRPSTESPFEDLKQLSVSPSPSTAPNFLTTRISEIYQHSTPSSTTLSGEPESDSTSYSSAFSNSASSHDFPTDSSDQQTVVIRPKTQYTYEAQEPGARIIYKFVPETTYNETDGTVPNVPNDSLNIYHQSSYEFSPERVPNTEYYNNLNRSTQDFYNDFNKNYNYEYFTEKDAGPIAETDFESQKMDHARESVTINDKQTASKKNMIFRIDPEGDMIPEYQNETPMHIDDREMPPPINDGDNEADESKNQYFVLYSVDDEEKKEKKTKKKQKTDPDVIYHHHHHQHEDGKSEDFHNFDTEFDSEFDSEVRNSDNVRIVDPNVRGARPLEFTKDDYLRHIKQAVVQYMKNYHPQDSSDSNNESIRETPKNTAYQPTKSAESTGSYYKNNLSRQQYKPMSPMKLPKNLYTTGRLKDAIDELQESPQVDLTVKRSKQKPFDISAIDVGQTYQHVSHFDHSAALKNGEDFDQTNVVMQSKPKLHFSQQTYHDINNLSYNKKSKKQTQAQVQDETENDKNNFRKYNLKGNNDEPSSYSAMNYDGSKLPRIVTHDEDENKVLDDPVDAPIQIINGIPVSNPYNIDLNTLKYMLGGIAQAEVNDQLKDFDESPSHSQVIGNNWKSYGANELGSYTSQNPVYQVYGSQENIQRPKKNPQRTGNYIGNNNQQSIVGSLVNFSKIKSDKQKSKIQKNIQNFALPDYSGWNHMNKKQRTEPSNTNFVLRPATKGNRSRDQLFKKGSINRARQPQLSTDMRPPPPKPKTSHLRLTKVL